MSARRRSRTPRDSPRRRRPASAAVVSRPSNDLLWLLPALLAVTLLAYQPAWQGRPLWDDDAHLTRPELQSATGLSRIWFDLGATQQYYPLAHTAFWVFHKLWGEAPLGYHLVNVSLHAISAFLVALLTRRLGIPGATLAATIFALHPVHVETVAWMTELKNTLSGVLYFGAALAYLRFDDSRRRASYVCALLLFALALLTKTVTAMLPLGLVAVLWWRRGRITIRGDLLPLLPFVLAGAGAGLFTAWVERTYVGAAGAEFEWTIVERFLIAGRAIWFYLAKLVAPVGLSFNYEQWDVSQTSWWQYLYPLGVLAFGVVFWQLRRRSRAPFAALVFYIVTLFPALGFFDVFPFRYAMVADHFQYLASVGMIVLGAASIATLTAALVSAPRDLVTTVLIGLPLGLLTWWQCHHYVNAETLWRETIRRNPASRLAHTNLGAILMDRPEGLSDAVVHLQTALRLGRARRAAPGTLLDLEWNRTHCNLALVLARAGRLDELPGPRAECARLGDDSAQARQVLAETARHAGLSHLRQGNLEPAITEFQAALGFGPSVRVLQPLAQALSQAGRTDAAIAALQEALKLETGRAAAPLRNDLGIVFAMAGRTADAAAEFTEALRLDPDFAAARNNLFKLKGGGR